MYVGYRQYLRILSRNDCSDFDANPVAVGHCQFARPSDSWNNRFSRFDHFAAALCNSQLTTTPAKRLCATFVQCKSLTKSSNHLFSFTCSLSLYLSLSLRAQSVHVAAENVQERAVSLLTCQTIEFDERWQVLSGRWASGIQLCRSTIPISDWLNSMQN